MEALKQKYPSAYYCCWIQYPGCDREHYMMFEGIRTRHSSKEEVIELCMKINKEHNLPNVTLQSDVGTIVDNPTCTV